MRDRVEFPTVDSLSSWSLGRILQWYLMTSYLYYVVGKSPIKDDVYDEMAKILLKNFKKLDHPHKHLVTVEDLKAGTLYTLKRNDYPLMVVNSAMRLIGE